MPPLVEDIRVVAYISEFTYLHYPRSAVFYNSTVENCRSGVFPKLHAHEISHNKLITI